MSTSTDAILVYGYHLPSQDDAELHIPEEASDLFGGQHPVQIGYHCSDSYTMPYVYIKKSEIRAYRGTPKPIEALKYEVGWDLQLREFAAKYGIPGPGDSIDMYNRASDLGWWLMSWWG